MFDTNLISSYLYLKATSQTQSSIKREKMENSSETVHQSNTFKMKIFQTIQKKFALVGISKAPAAQSESFNWRLLMSFISLYSEFITILLYIMLEAETFAEYIQLAFLLSLTVQITFDLSIIIIKTKKMFELIDHFESIINTSKHHRYQLYRFQLKTI